MPAQVYLGGLPENVTIEEVYEHLAMYGQIHEIILLQGFGFVEFDDEQDAFDVVRAFAGRPFLGSDVKVQLARNPRRDRARGSRRDPSPDSSPLSRMRSSTVGAHSPEMKFPVEVTGLRRGTSWQELKKFGRSLGGEIAYCDVDRVDHTRGFLDFTQEEDAEQAVKELSGKNLLGNIVQLTRYVARRGEYSITQVMRNRSRSPVRTQRQPSITSPSPGPRTEDRHDQRQLEKCSWDRVSKCSWNRDDSASAYVNHSQAAIGDGGHDAPVSFRPDHILGDPSRRLWMPDLGSYTLQPPISESQTDMAFGPYL